MSEFPLPHLLIKVRQGQDYTSERPLPSGETHGPLRFYPLYLFIFAAPQDDHSQIPETGPSVYAAQSSPTPDLEANMNIGMTGKLGITVAFFCSFLALPACQKKEEGPKPCCEQPDIPAGVAKFKVVAEDVTGPSDGQKVMIRAALLSPTKREQLYAPMKLIYAHVMKRSPFEPIHFETWFFANEYDASSGAEAKAVGKIIRAQDDKAPKCENRIKYDFNEQVERAFIWSTEGEQALQEDMNDTCHIADKKKRARFDEKFTRKTTYKADPGNLSVTVTYPFLEMGKDEYANEVKINSAMGIFSEFMTSMFSQAEPLKSLVFVGVWKDETILRISVSRQQFENTLSRLQESIAAHSAITFGTLGMGRKTTAQAEKEQEQFKSKTYKAALEKLPKEQVSISPKLKWVR